MSDPTLPDDLSRADAAARSASDAPADSAADAAGADATPVTDAPPPSVDQVKLALRKVKDPELNLNIVDLGLIYDISVDGSEVDIDMSLTSPGCPAGPEITGDVERAVKSMPGVSAVNLKIVWDPFWTPDRIEPRVRAYMGL